VFGDVIVEPRELATLKGHTKKVYALKYCSSKSDGFAERLVSAGQEGIVFVWDVATKKKLCLPIKHNFVRAVAMNSAGNRLALGGMDNAISFYNIENAMEPTKIKTFAQDDHDGYVSDVSFMPGDDTKMCSTSGDQVAIFWDCATAKPIHWFKGHTADVNNCSFAQDAPQIVSTSSNDETIRVWDCRNGKCVRMCKLDGEVNYCATFPSGNATTFCNDNGKFGLFDIGSNSVIEQVQHKGKGARLLCSCISVSGRYFYMGMSTGQLTVASTFKCSKWRCVKAHESYVCSIGMASDGSSMATGSFDNTIKIWGATPPAAK